MSEREPLRPFDGVELWSVNSETLMLSLVRLSPNTIVPQHHHVNEQAGSVVSGRLTFTIGEESRDVVAGQGYLIPPGAPHGAVAGPDGCLVVEVFSPPRDGYRMPASLSE